MRRLHNPAIFLAALLQVLPICRNIITNPAVTSNFAIILRWAVGATAAASAVDAVSGATSYFSSTNHFNGTVGTYFTNNVVCTIGGGNTASSSDYMILTSGSVTTPPLSNGQTTTTDLPPGLTFQCFSINNSKTIWGAIYGTPTVATTNFPLTVMVVSPGNASLSTNITITILASSGPTAPGITGQPINVTNVTGAMASFSVTASGTAPLAYQWFKNSAALADGGNISGSASNVLTIASLTTNDSGNYSVVVTNSAGSVTSSNAALTVLVPPAISSPPASQTLNAGLNAIFSVAATGTSPLNYRWMKNGLTVTNGSKFTGATSNVLTVLNLATNDGGNYSVAVTNAAGSVTSSNAVLTVNVPATPPAITAQPANVTAQAGSNATFSVTVTGTAPLAYQWLKNHSPLANGGNIAGANATVLSVSSLTTNDAGLYTVVVTNVAGSTTSSNAVLTVNVPASATAPSITSQPASVTASAGSNVTFSVTVTGTAPLAYQWLKNHSPLADGGNIAGANATVLSVSSLTTNDAGLYTVVVTNVAGSTTSSNAVLTVNVPASAMAPSITTQPASVATSAGSNVTFSVTTSGTAPLAFRWLKNGAPLAGAARIAGVNSNVLAISAVSTNDAGIYSVIVTNAAGTAVSSNATLTVNLPATGTVPVIIIQPTSQISARGGTVSFGVAAAGTGPLAYQWLMNGSNLIGSALVAGVNSNVLTLAAITVSNSGNYSVVVTNAFGSVTSQIAALTVTLFGAIVAPTFTVQPSNVVASAGGQAVFRVRATGAASYHWFRNGAALTNNLTVTGTGSNILTIANLSANDAGVYFATAANAAGSANSSNATLQVNVPVPVVPPAIIGQPAGLNKAVGSNAVFSVTATGTGPLVYQWLKNHSPLVLNPRIAGTSSNVLVISALTTNDAGVYSVVVSNLAGSIVSSNVTLTVSAGSTVHDNSGVLISKLLRTLPPPQLNRNPDGTVTLAMNVQAGVSFVIEASTDLASPNWISLATNNPAAGGSWQLTDTNAVHYPCRFYRVR